VGGSGAFVVDGFDAFELAVPVVGVPPALLLAVSGAELVSVGELVLTVALPEA
jgi:hypothetical protein